MKYPKNSILKFTTKALRKAKVTADERLIVLNKDTVISYNNTTLEVTQLDMLKTQDSFVELANEVLPVVLYISKNVARTYDPAYTKPLMLSYNIQFKT